MAAQEHRVFVERMACLVPQDHQETEVCLVLRVDLEHLENLVKMEEEDADARDRLDHRVDQGHRDDQDHGETLGEWVLPEDKVHKDSLECAVLLDLRDAQECKAGQDFLEPMRPTAHVHREALFTPIERRRW